jgi:hypothetical protein
VRSAHKPNTKRNLALGSLTDSMVDQPPLQFMEEFRAVLGGQGWDPD